MPLMPSPYKKARFWGFCGSQCRIRDIRVTNKRVKGCGLYQYFQSFSQIIVKINRGNGRGFLTPWHNREAFQLLSQAVSMFHNSCILSFSFCLCLEALKGYVRTSLYLLNYTYKVGHISCPFTQIRLAIYYF